jgi:hypothetical protein
LNTGIIGLNLTSGLDVCLDFSTFVLFCVGKDLAIHQPPVQGDYQMSKRSIFSESNFELVQTRKSGKAEEEDIEGCSELCRIIIIKIHCFIRFPVTGHGGP